MGVTWRQGDTYNPSGAAPQQQTQQQPQQQPAAPSWGSSPAQSAGWGNNPSQPPPRPSAWDGPAQKQQATQQPKQQADQQTEQQPQEQPAKSKKKIPIKYIAIGGAAIFVIVITLVIIINVFSKNNDIMGTPGSVPEDPLPANPIDDDFDAYLETIEVAYSYTEEEKQELRAWGYTGDEIEQFESEERDVAELVAASKQAQEEMRATLSNPESEEYKALLNDTWLGQPSFDLPEYNDSVPYEVEYHSYTFNADYEKIPAHGTNLYLKVDMGDGSFHFMECPLDLYMKLADAGNIVVTYKTVTYQGVTVIYDMKNVEV